ncbi:jg22646 [Pararge aegeria aegeria]|uniref:Jg22646 protein n=1 Tax=Pararge aegeria aegeria TaxID=348720 RepID=A0A8S4R6S9_9NEOP|nr:jg22646 [Pararge aegeria aegeria]
MKSYACHFRLNNRRAGRRADRRPGKLAGRWAVSGYAGGQTGGQPGGQAGGQTGVHLDGKTDRRGGRVDLGSQSVVYSFCNFSSTASSKRFKLKHFGFKRAVCKN